MQNTLKQIKKIAREVRLSAEEKSGMREELFQHMKANPARNPIHSNRPLMERYGSIPSPFSLISKFRNNFGRASKDTARHDFAKSTMPLLIILGLLMGGSVSFAAENAVPGDILFPVKIHINESVRGVIAITPQAKAEWEIHLVERRLKEIEKLATEPDASSDVKNIAQSNLERYIEHTKERISKFEDEDDNEDALIATERLTKLLSNHESILNTLGANSAIAGGVATTTAEAMNNEEDKTSLKEALKTLHEIREYSEKKNKEIEYKRSLKGEEKHITSPDFSDREGGNQQAESSNGKEDGNNNAKGKFRPSSIIPVAVTSPDNIFSTTTIDTAPHKIEDGNDYLKENAHNPIETEEKVHN